MIPFSGILPGAAGPAPAAAGKAAPSGNSTAVLSHPGGKKPPVDADACSFLQWIQQLVGGDSSAKSDAKNMTEPGNSGNNLQMPAFDRLQSLIAEAMNQQSTGKPDAQTENDKGLDALYNLVPPWIIQALIARNDSGKAMDNDVQKTLAAIENAMESTQHSATGAPASSNAKEQPLKTLLSAMAARAFQEDDRAIKGDKNGANPSSQAKPEKEPVDVALKAASKDVAVKSSDKDRGTAEALSAAASLPKKAVDTGTVHSHGSAAHIKASGSAAAVATVAGTSARQDDTTDFAGHDEHRQKDQQALKTIDADHLPKTHLQDSLKSASADATRSQASFQDAVKSMSVDPSAQPAGKSTVGQATPLPRPDAPTANMYQTSVMDQIVDKATVRLEQGRSEVQIRLKPDFLGNVHMNIASDKNQLVVRIVTDQPMVKNIIETHLHQLTTQLQNQGLVIHRFDVTVNPDAARHQHNDQFSQMFRHNSFQNDRRQPRQQNPQPWNHGGGKPSDDDPSGFEGVNYFA